MLHIDRLSIRLPKAFEHRASDIAHQLAGSLSGMSLANRLSMDRLVVPVISVNPQATNREIANSMATAIHAGIGGNK